MGTRNTEALKRTRETPAEQVLVQVFWSWALAQHKAWVLSISVTTQLKAFNCRILMTEMATVRGTRPCGAGRQKPESCRAVTESFCDCTLHRAPR